MTAQECCVQDACIHLMCIYVSVCCCMCFGVFQSALSSHCCSMRTGLSCLYTPVAYLMWCVAACCVTAGRSQHLGQQQSVLREKMLH